MIVNADTIARAFKGFKSVYSDAYSKAPSHYDRIAQIVPSASSSETYGWLGAFPQLREWLSGDRVVRDFAAHGFEIANREFESTIGIKREDFADDRLGVFAPRKGEMGALARAHPDELVFGLQKAGSASLCYDGQNFFDTDPPAARAGGTTVTVSNCDVGTEPAWFLLDTNRAVKPLVWQEREKYDFQSLTRPNDAHVFMTDEYLYGVRARVNAGFGLWQLAQGSRLDLTAANHAAMQICRGDTGRLPGLRPTVLVVPPALEEAALTLLNASTSLAREDDAPAIDPAQPGPPVARSPAPSALPWARPCPGSCPGR